MTIIILTIFQVLYLKKKWKISSLKRLMRFKIYSWKLTFSLSHSLNLQDIFIICSLYSGIHYSASFSPNYFPLNLGRWITYWVLQSTLFTAIFILGHDCGHGTFCNNDVINDLIGNLCHTFVLTPYYPWKLSHRVHHKNTGNMDKDEIFYPIRKGILKGRNHHYLKLFPYFGLGLGWFAYLFKGYGFTTIQRKIRHFNPWDPSYRGHEMDCCLSLFIYSIWIFGPCRWYLENYGVIDFIVSYLLPVFGFACWIVIITFLHHQDKGVPWYGNDNWSFVAGQLSSVDRDYGWAHEILHNIGTHQIHHLFTKIPHYYLEEATKAFRDKYPELVRKSSDPIVSSYYERCHKFEEQQVCLDRDQIHIFVK